MFEWISRLWSRITGHHHTGTYYDPIENPDTTLHVEPPVDFVVDPKYTNEDLRALTKKQIDELAFEKFGVKLDRRLRRDTLVNQFLEAQETHGK